MDVLGFVKQHPAEVGIGVFAVGIAFLMLRGGGSSNAGSTDAALGSAYYAALSQQSQDSTALAIAQSNNAAKTTQTQISADTYTAAQNTWSATDLAETNANNQAAIAEAPYATESELISTLGAIAQLPPTTTTSKSNGFFGIGGGTKTTVTQNPNAAAAGSAINELINGLFPHS